jgi:hypothetical protein
MTNQLTILTFILAPAALGACASAAGTRPHDMSVESHQTAAADEERQAATHAQQHDPDAKTAEESCTREGTERRACWADSVNPTAEHEKLAQEHRDLAAKHRAAASALVTAEAKACGGIDEMDRDMSPFAHKADIRSVRELKETIRNEFGNEEQRTIGASVRFRAVPGMTAQWLQRLVDCHLARNAALGHDVPEMEYCPLVPKGVTATVKAADDGFVVEIRGDTAATTQETLRRAQLLVEKPTTGSAHAEHETRIR